MNELVFQRLENFLNDFHYEKLNGFDLFQQESKGIKKCVIVNCTPYNDGFMLELQLGIIIKQIEQYILSFNNQSSEKLTLTYWESLYNVGELGTKRHFIQNFVELDKVMHELENALIKSGFSWLDNYSNLNQISNYLKDIIFRSIQKPINFLKICQRSYLLRLMLKEKLCDSDFYEYYENMQSRRLPDHQLEEFLSFKNYIDNNYNSISEDIN